MSAMPRIYSSPDIITKELLHELFHYEKGELYWKISPKINVNVGDPAGYIETRGYKVIKLFGKKYKAHKLIYFYHHGYFPQFLDHINNDRIDNRIENLRIASREQNNQNACIRKDNTSGIKGVCYCKRTEKWIVQLQYNKKKIKKYCHTIEDAKMMIEKLREQYHKEYSNHGYV